MGALAEFLETKSVEQVEGLTKAQKTSRVEEVRFLT